MRVFDDGPEAGGGVVAADVGAVDEGLDTGSPNCKPFSGVQVRPPSSLGVPYISFSFLVSSSSINSIKAFMIARSLASSSSDLVLNPLLSDCFCAAFSTSLLPEPHPSVILLRLLAASAITFRMSVPGATADPPSF